MNERIRKILEDDSIKNGYGKIKNDEQLLEIITDYDKIEKTLIDERRWYNLYEYVIKVGNHFLSYADGECTGDDSVRDMGIEIDLDAIYEMEEYKETVTKYKIKGV